MATKSDEFIPTRASLLKRLRDWDDHESWQQFFNTYWKLIYSVARKSGLADADCQDIVQETIIYVAKKMPDFRYDSSMGSFKAWLMNLTRWRIIDYLRKQRLRYADSNRPGEQNSSTSIVDRQPAEQQNQVEAIWEEEWQKHALQAALRKAKRQASAAHYQMFLLHVVKNLPAKEVAKRLQVKLAEVYFAKYKIGHLVRKEIKHLENRMI